MIVLTLEPGEDEKLAEGAPGLQRKYGMPIDPAPYARPFSSEPACRAVVAARVNAPGAEEALLRRLRVRTMLGGLLDDPGLLGGRGRGRRPRPGRLAAGARMRRSRSRCAPTSTAARSPRARRAARSTTSSAARREERRYTAPSYEIVRSEAAHLRDPGFNPIEAYEAAMAQPRPDLARRPSRSRSSRCSRGRASRWRRPRSSRSCRSTRPRPAPRSPRRATPMPAGADFYWTLRGEWAVPHAGVPPWTASCGDRRRRVRPRPRRDRVGRGRRPREHGSRGGRRRPTRPAAPRPAPRDAHARPGRPLQGPRRRLPRPRAGPRHGEPTGGDAKVRRVRATGRGTFALAFSGVQACGGVEGVARGSRGSHASFQFSTSPAEPNPAYRTLEAGRTPAARRRARSASPPGRPRCSPSRCSGRRPARPGTPGRRCTGSSARRAARASPGPART